MIGQTLGSYRIIEQIGLGGMATVYKAYDPATDRYVAIKTLAKHFSHDSKFRERFRREARAIARLEHPHILPVHSYGEDDGIAYLVMRYLQSGTLKERIEAKEMSVNEALYILSQLADALDYAHEQGVIHRDIKPSNVLLDENGNAYLSDFGIAKMVEVSVDLTGGGLLGTPAYMSPEQCKGGEKLTPASDQYSLGIVLYEMLTGRTPYQAETPVALIHMHLTEPLPLPRLLRPNLPEDVENVILKALAKDPQDRFPNCRALAEALNEQPLDDLFIPTSPDAVTIDDTLPQHRERGSNPTWLIVLAGIAGLVVLIGGLTLTGVFGSQESPQAETQTVEPQVSETDSPTSTPEMTPTRSLTQPADDPTATTEPVQPIITPISSDGFAAPILSAIASTPPNFEDDFSGDLGGWEIYATGGDGSADVGGVESALEDGALVVSTLPRDIYANVVNQALWYNNFVLETDLTVRQAARRDEEISVIWRQSQAGHYRLKLNWTLTKWQFEKWSGTPGSYRIVVLASGRLNSTTHRQVSLRVIASGSQFAFYADDRLLAAVDDDSFPTGEAGAIFLFGAPTEETTVIFDNVRLWDLDNLASAGTSPAEEFAAPILASIANIPPDFEDDFSTNDGGWSWDSMAGQVSIASGVMQITGNGGAGIQRPPGSLRSMNFVWQFDITHLGGDGLIGTFFRNYTSTTGYVFLIGPDGVWDVGRNSPDGYDSPASGSMTLASSQTIQVVIIARDQEFAIYLNEQPAAYFVDDSILHAGDIMLTFRGSPVEGQFDNIRYWNLDN